MKMESRIIVSAMQDVRKVLYQRIEIDRRLCEKAYVLGAILKDRPALDAEASRELLELAKAAKLLDAEDAKFKAALLLAMPSFAIPN